MSKAPSFKVSADTRFLIQELSKLKEGDEITYAELTKRSSIDIDGGTPALQSARRILLRDSEMVFDVIRGQGIRRLTQSEILKSTSSEIRGIRQKARKGSRKIRAIYDQQNMTKEQQLDLTIKAAVFTVVEESASNQGQKKIGAVAQATKAAELPMGQIAAAFLSTVQKNMLIGSTKKKTP